MPYLDANKGNKENISSNKKLEKLNQITGKTTAIMSHGIGICGGFLNKSVVIACTNATAYLMQLKRTSNWDKNPRKVNGLN